MIDRRGLIAAGLATAFLPAAARAAARPGALRLEDFTTVAKNLDKPECVAVTRDGLLIVSILSTSAVAIIGTDGGATTTGVPVAPTGIALDRQERVVIANMGLLNGKPGTLERLDLVTGKSETLAAEVDGRALVGSNAPAIARDGTIYVTHSSWGPAQNIGTSTPAGFVYMVRPDGRVQTVAKDLRGPNGIAFDAAERWLYVSLTAEGRVVRFRRKRDGTLGPREYYGPVLGAVTPDHMIGDIIKLSPPERAKLGYCDNFALDVAGNLWICLPFANRIVALTPKGEVVPIVHDPEGRVFKTPTSLAWGGRDMRDLYVVSRMGGAVVKARTDVAGLRLVNQA